MSIGGWDEAALKRFLEDQLQTPGVAPTQSLPFQNLKMGTTTLAWAAASTESEHKVISHGLGVVPSWIGFTAVAGGGGGVIPQFFELEGATTDSQFTVYGLANVEGPYSYTLRWLAVA